MKFALQLGSIGDMWKKMEDSPFDKFEIWNHLKVTQLLFGYKIEVPELGQLTKIFCKNLWKD